MRRLLLTLICVLLSALAAWAQAPEARTDEKPVVEAVDLAGVPESRISQHLKDLLQELVGKPFDQIAADEVAFEIQNELKERMSAIRQVPGTQPTQIRLIFEVGRVSLDEDENVNSRYIVESVEIRGIPEGILSARLRRDLRDLVGQRLGRGRGDEIEERIQHELGRTRVVSRRVSRGSDRDHVRVVFEVERAPLLQFRHLDTYILYHSKQNFSVGLEGPLGTRHNRLTLGYVNDGDALLERYEGWHIGFENIRAGTDRVGFRLDYYDFHEKWKAATELALNTSASNVPGLYRSRRSFEPAVNIAIDSRVRLSFGASISELQMQQAPEGFLNTNAGVAEVSVDNRWDSGRNSEQRLTARYRVRSSTPNLDSDFIYTSHTGEVRYVFSSRSNQFIATAMAGRINGSAPLFERFSLGNTSTLRGWNKYDLAAAGGNRLGYGSLEYRFNQLQLYYDVGSVWDQGQTRKMSHAVGFGVHNKEDDNDSWFVTFAVPIRSGRIQPLKPVIMLGFRF